MKKILSLSLYIVLTTPSMLAIQVNFDGSQKEIISIVPEKSTGLENIYVVYDISEISSIRVSGIESGCSISKYSNLGGGFSEPVQFIMSGNEAIINNPEGNMGYIVDENGRSSCFWVVNYLPEKFSVSNISPEDEQDCNNTRIIVSGAGEPIHYYTIDGRQAELNREIKVSYLNLEWDNDKKQYDQITQIKVLAHLSNPVILTPPLYCNAQIEIDGDKFLEQWGMPVHKTSELLYANGVEVYTEAEQTNLGEETDGAGSNQIKTEIRGMGGSAPVDISFRAYTTDAVVHNEWQIASDPEFEYIDYRFNEQTVDYSFTEEGTYYVRFIGSNNDGSCEAVGETYTVSVGASELKIPNAFTPNDDGVNDIWKVAYRSLLSFRCSIFDRYGNELYSFTDPTQGWDGKYKGKYVKPGVYFYVIEARGSDGKTYKKGGDINIIKSKRTNSANNSTE